jgi:hypothetical protein
MIPARDVNARDGAEKAMGHQLALDFVPDLRKTGIEFLPDLLLFHATYGTPLRACARAAIGETQGRRMARRRLVHLTPDSMSILNSETTRGQRAAKQTCRAQKEEPGLPNRQRRPLRGGSCDVNKNSYHNVVDTRIFSAGSTLEPGAAQTRRPYRLKSSCVPRSTSRRRPLCCRRAYPDPARCTRK